MVLRLAEIASLQVLLVEFFSKSYDFFFLRHVLLSKHLKIVFKAFAFSEFFKQFINLSLLQLNGFISCKDLDFDLIKFTQQLDYLLVLELQIKIKLV